MWYQEGQHGAYFSTPADGVEAHIQHLYAYASKQPLPAGKDIVDPRFTLVGRGIASTWSDLDGRWAVPGIGYGQSILNDYYKKAITSDNQQMQNLVPTDRVKQLERKNEILKMEIESLKKQINSPGTV